MTLQSIVATSSTRPRTRNDKWPVTTEATGLGRRPATARQLDKWPFARR